MTSNDLMQKVVNDNPFMKSMEMEFLELSPGHAVVRIPFLEHFTNPYGSYHGGILYALGDCVAGTAACLYGHYVTTVNGCFHYMLPALHTEYIYCHADALRAGKTLIVMDVKILDDKGALLNSGSYTFYKTDKPLTDSTQM